MGCGLSKISKINVLEVSKFQEIGKKDENQPNKSQFLEPITISIDKKMSKAFLEPESQNFTESNEEDLLTTDEVFSITLTLLTNFMVK